MIHTPIFARPFVHSACSIWKRKENSCQEYLCFRSHAVQAIIESKVSLKLIIYSLFHKKVLVRHEPTCCCTLLCNRSSINHCKNKPLNFSIKVIVKSRSKCRHELFKTCQKKMQGNQTFQIFPILILRKSQGHPCDLQKFLMYSFYRH